MRTVLSGDASEKKKRILPLRRFGRDKGGTSRGAFERERMTARYKRITTVPLTRSSAASDPFLTTEVSSRKSFLSRFYVTLHFFLLQKFHSLSPPIRFVFIRQDPVSVRGGRTAADSDVFNTPAPTVVHAFR